MLHHAKFRRLVLGSTALVLVGGAAPATAATCVWGGGVGEWAAGPWSCGTTPGAGDDVRIDGKPGITSLVTITGVTQNAATLLLDGGDTLSLIGGGLGIANHLLTANGTVSLASNSVLYSTNGALALGGTGTIALDNIAGAARLGGNGNLYTIGSGLTVQGAGEVGFDASLVINNGLVNANLAGRALTLDVSAGSGGVSGNLGGPDAAAALRNTGTLQASNGGALRFSSGRYDNTDGTIQALAGSGVFLDNDVRVQGGSLTTVGSGRINANDSSQYLAGVTLTTGSTLSVSNDYVYVDGTLTDNGTITLANNGRLRTLNGTGALAGTGTVTLDNSQNVAILGDNGGTFTIGAGITVNGSGTISNDNAYFVNNGLISATGSIVVDPYAGSGGSGSGLGTDGTSGFVNNATLQAANGGTLTLAGGRYDNTAGIIRSLAGGTVDLGNDVYLRGGTVTGPGAIVANDDSQYVAGVTLASGSTLALSNDYIYVDGTLTNNGTITVANASRLRTLNGTGTLAGTGTVTLNNVQNFAILGDNGGTFTIGSGITVNGAGSVGNDNANTVNNGLISATAGTIALDPYAGSNGSGSGLGVDLTSGFVNNGTLQGANGGTLAFNGGRYDNTGGTIRALAGGTVDFNNDVYLRGGTITGPGTISANDDSQFFNGVTLASGSTLAMSNDFLYVDGTLTNNGTITIANASRLRTLNGTGTIAGTGTVTLDNRQNYAVLGDNGGTFTIGAGITVNGAGSVGNDNGYIVNNGLISATTGTIALDPVFGSGGSGSALGVDGISGFINNATVQAANGSTLALFSGRFDNTNGTIRSLAGGTVDFNGDVYLRGGTISGPGAITATDDSQFFNGVTIAAGSTLAMNNDFLYVDGTLTDNGTITIANASRLRTLNGTGTIAGTGTVTLDNRQNYAVLGDNGGTFTIGAGITVNGAGSVSNDNAFLVNNGTISATAGTITVDPVFGSGGSGSSGLGTDGTVGVFNTGLIGAAAGGNTLQLASGRFEQSATGAFAAGTGSTFTMLGDANLVNLGTGGVLDRGQYRSVTTGAASVVDLRAANANAITQIGGARAGTDTVVTLSGANSVLQVTPFNGGTPVTIDQSLTTIAQSGRLEINNGRIFAASNNVGNAGAIALGGGTFTQPGALANGGLVTGNGTVGVTITNTGSVVATGGTLTSGRISGLTGTVGSDAGGTLSLAGAGGASQAGLLRVNGALALGGNDILVRNDYTNASFGTGNAFNPRAGVTGAGRILAESATQDLSGPGLNLAAGTLNVGNVRLGGSSSTTLTITNNGTLTTLRGAVESGAGNTVGISSNSFVVGPNGGSTTVTLSYTGTQAGSLSGNTVTVANNFDNIADPTLQITGAAYNPAAAQLSPNPINLGATRVGGTLSGTVTITNTAPAGQFSESLAVTGTTGANGATGTRPTGLIAAGASAASTVTLDTSVSGTRSGTVTYALATDGTGTSGLAQMALPSQVETVTGKVYQLAVAQLGTNSVTFATVRQGSAAPTATVSLTNGANGALNDTLNTTIGSLPSGVTGTAPGPLAGGQAGALSFRENTGTAGNYSGTGRIDFTSTDPDLALANLPSQTVAFNGTVTQVAVAQILKDFGTGTLTGGGTDYFLDLGSFSGSGSVSTDLGVLNAIPNFSFDETLGGTFGANGGAGYTFAGQTFSGLTGGSTRTGNVLGFNFAGLADGTYTNLLTFNGYSRYAGLDDQQLGPIRVNVTARVTGGVTPPTGAVPEPGSWAMTIVGIGALGVTLRRRKPVQAAGAAA